jgi:uncharacterized protein involved in exopolysaccharide biosynthesis
MGQDLDDVFLIRAANVLLRWRGRVVLVGFLGAVIAVGITVVLPRTYTAGATFTPQGREAPSGAAALAARFGVGIPGGEPSQSPAFYADLARSSHVLRLLAADTVTTDSAAPPVPLVSLLKVRGATPMHLHERGARKLRKMVGVEVVQRTGVVSLTVRSKWALVSTSLAERLLEIVNRFNLENRRSQAAAEREFAERRLAELGDELRAAENAHLRFLQHNRGPLSPELRFEEGRLAREVGFRQQLVTSMAESFEQSRLEEIRDTPVITVIEPPIVPVFPDRRGLARKALLGLVLGGGLVGMMALLQAVGRPASRQDPRAEFEELVAEVRGQMWGALRGGRRGADRAPDAGREA